MRRMKGTEGREDYILVGENQNMWLAVKPFIVRMPVGWSCCVGLRYRGGHDARINITDPTANGLAWIAVEWQKAELSHASASYPMIGMNAADPVTPEQLFEAITDDNVEQIVMHVCQRVDPRTRVHDFNPDNMKGHVYEILRMQCHELPPGQDVPESIKHLPPEEITERCAAVLKGFMESGAPSDYPYEKQGSKTMEKMH